MGIANKLIELMKTRDTNANELAKKAGIPPTTVYSLIKRDSKRVDIDSLIKIARALGTTADCLCGNDSNSASLGLSPDESELISCYRKLSREGQDELIKRAHELLDLGYIKSDPIRMVE